MTDDKDQRPEAENQEQEKTPEKERKQEAVDEEGLSALERYLERHGPDLFVPIEDEPGA